MGNYRPFLQGPLPVANYTRIIIPGRFWTRPPSTKSTRMASSATPLHDPLIELAIPDAHAHAIKWYLNCGLSTGIYSHVSTIIIMYACMCTPMHVYVNGSYIVLLCQSLHFSTNVISQWETNNQAVPNQTLDIAWTVQGILERLAGFDWQVAHIYT